TGAARRRDRWGRLDVGRMRRRGPHRSDAGLRGQLLCRARHAAARSDVRGRGVPAASRPVRWWTPRCAWGKARRLMSTILQLAAVGRSFGELRAVDDVWLEVRTGARHALIGPNGAGKTTLFNLIAGSMSPTSGRIALAGEDITRMSEYRRAIRGMARTFQHSKLFLGET